MSFSPEMKEAGLASCFGKLDEKESRWVTPYETIAKKLSKLERSTFCSCRR